MELAARHINQVSPTASSVGIAICYQCSYRSSDSGSNCPDCSFPLIMQSELSPPGGFRIEDVLKRESLRLGAPPLPGVDATPRKAQLLAEARKRIRDTARQAKQVDTRAKTEEAEATIKRSVWSLVSVCCLAVGIGIVAAAVQSVLL